MTPKSSCCSAARDAPCHLALCRGTPRPPAAGLLPQEVSPEMGTVGRVCQDLSWDWPCGGGGLGRGWGGKGGSRQRPLCRELRGPGCTSEVGALQGRLRGPRPPSPLPTGTSGVVPELSVTSGEAASPWWSVLAGSGRFLSSSASW